MRTVIFGVDGLTFKVLHPMIERGELPNFKKLAEQGSEAILESKYPPLTPPAWTSLATGMKPAKHGVYDFWVYEEQADGSLVPRVQTKRRGGKAIWNILSEYGKQVLVVNVPLTYPPEPINGIMVSGYMTPSAGSEFTYPVSFKEELFKVVPDYQIDLDLKGFFRQPDPYRRLAEVTISMTERRIKLISHMLKEKPWDFAYVAFVGPDRLQHSIWEEIMAFEPWAVEYFRLLDQALGQMLEQLGPDDNLFVVSDHGFQGVTHTFNINEYLRLKGLLTAGSTEEITKANQKAGLKQFLKNIGLIGLLRKTRKKLKRAGMIQGNNKDYTRPLMEDMDMERTLAYVPSLSGYPSSFVDIFLRKNIDADTIAEIKAALESEVEPRSGKKLVQAIYTQEIYGEGPFTPREPRLLVLPNDAITFRMGLGGNWIWDETSKVRGTHHKDGVFYAYGGGIKQGFKAPNAEVFDLVPTVLHSMGLPFPHAFDGRVLQELFIEQKQTEQATTEKKAEGGRARKKLQKLLEV